MNILYLCDEYPPGRHGGIGTLVQFLAREMAALGHHVVVTGYYDWGYGGADEFVDKGVKVYRFRRKFNNAFFSNKNSLLVRGVYKAFRLSGVFQWDITRSIKQYHAHVEDIIKEHNIDIIEKPDFSEYVQFCTKYTPLPQLSKPTVAKMNGTITYFLREAGKEVPGIISQMEKTHLEEADSLASASQYTADKTKAYLQINRPVKVLYNGIDTNLLTHIPTKKEATVFFSGSLVPKKGIYQLIKAWNIVHQQMPNAELLVFGKGPIDKIKQLLTAAAANTVKFKGHVSHSELFNYLAESNIAVFPSYAEAFALAPMEAMACGTAVIYSTRSSGAELITDGENGFLIDPDDVEKIADQILYLLNDPNICSAIAQKGKERIKDFDIKQIALEHEIYYSEVIANSTR